MPAAQQDNSHVTSGTVIRPANGPITQKWANGGIRISDTQAIGGHPGTDYGVPDGTPVKAAADGVVSFAGPASGFGDHCVSIWHPAFGVTTLYGHMGSHTVKAGDSVSAGQVIGLSDNQGTSTGPHLHFEVRPVNMPFGGNPPNIDSEVWLKTHGAITGGASGSTTDSGTSPTIEQTGLLSSAAGALFKPVINVLIDAGMIAAGMVAIAAGLLLAFRQGGNAIKLAALIR